MTKKKLSKTRFNKGKWVQSRRCMGCNSISSLIRLGEDRRKFEDSGKILDENGEKVDCTYLCEKGWFYSRGTTTT